MPELPEVQTVVNDLNKKVIGRKITGAWFDWPKVIKAPRPAAFERFLKSERILRAKRRGKNILIYLSGNKLLLVHQKMTGHMLVGKWKVEKNKRPEPIEPRALITDPYNKYVHLILYLDNGKMLALSDLRKFAKVIAGPVSQIENLPELKKLGPDALDPKFQYVAFKKTIGSEGRKIHQVLMDQEVIAGIGNIYSSDILWMAKVHPFKSAKKLSEKELKAIWQAIHKVLPRALKLRGTSVSDFRDTAGEKGKYGNVLLAYRREGEPCRRCGTKIKRVKLGGRSAHYCPKCQVL